MATVLLGERKGTRRSSLTNRGAKVIYEETLTYIVESDAFDEPQLTVLSTTGLPLVMIDSITGTFGFCLCTGKSASQNKDNGKIWDVECTFTTDIEGQDTETGGDPADPTTWIPRYKGTFEFMPKVLYKDFTEPDPKPYLNSAGDRFPDPMIYRRPITVYEFWQIEDAVITDIEIGDRNDSINETTFRDFDAETLKLQVSGFERGFWYGIDAVKIDYKVSYFREGWRNSPAQVGYGYRESAGGNRVASDTLVFLDTDGTKLPDSTVEPLYGDFLPSPLLEFNDFLR